MTIAAGAAVTPESISLTGGVATTTAGSTTTQASGSTFVIILRAYSDNYSAVTDSFSNTYTLQRKIQNTSDTDWLHIYLCSNGTGGAVHKPKVTSAITQLVNFGLHEITGAASSSVDVVSTGAFDQATPFGDPVTSTNANDIILGYFGGNGSTTTVTYTPGSGFTTFPSAGFNTGTDGLSTAVVYQVASSTGTYNPAITASAGGRGAAITLALKASASGPSIAVLSSAHQRRRRV